MFRDFSWTTFSTEWNTYAHLAASGEALPWMAEAFEFGLVRLGDGVAPW